MHEHIQGSQRRYGGVMPSTSRDLLNTPIVSEALSSDSPLMCPRNCPMDDSTDSTTDSRHINGLSDGQSACVNIT